MAKWVSLKPEWTLQDVQAGLNVVIAFLCAGGIFVLVRYCWLVAARRVAQKKDVPAYALLSLNTIGETIDVIWLLRHDIFTNRYKTLLLQCVFVMILTVATLMSGFIARWSTRLGEIVKEQSVNGTISERTTGNLLYAEVDINVTMSALEQANFPPNQLLDFLPNPDRVWDYVPEQWNSTWKLECSYNKSVQIPNPRATGNCTNFGTEFPSVYDNYRDWYASDDDFTWYWQSTGWRDTPTVWKDWNVFTHGIRSLNSSWNDKLNVYTKLEMRTVSIYLQDVPWNSSIKEDCNFATGPIKKGTYNSCNCMMTRDVSEDATTDSRYGAYPDGSDVGTEVQAYLDHYGNRVRKESGRHLPVTQVEGEELVMFYQAYQATKDTSTSANVFRDIDVYIRVPQVSLICLIVCSVLVVIDILGLLSYWVFLWRHWSHLDQTPQSKLDWMLQTLRRENDAPVNMRHRLTQVMTSGAEKNENLPLNRIDSKQDRHSIKSVTSSTFVVTPEGQYAEDPFENAPLSANFSGRTPTNTWFPQQYERVGPNPGRGSWSLGHSNNDYHSVQQQSPYMWQGTSRIDTAYDPGRR